jgi:hypothetical protein
MLCRENHLYVLKKMLADWLGDRKEDKRGGREAII